MFRFDELIEKSRELYIAPIQSTCCVHCGYRALVKSFKQVDIIVYLFRQPIADPPYHKLCFESSARTD